MSIERTLSIIKPDACKRRLEDTIIAIFKERGLKPIASYDTLLHGYEAAAFYKEHEGRPYYTDLINFMTSGMVHIMVLEGENAIALNREIMGATKEPAEGTIRHKYATSVMNNCVHGSDSPESAKREIKFFFAGRILI
jgi:nucleoside-diphosphate kinase